MTMRFWGGALIALAGLACSRLSTPVKTLVLEPPVITQVNPASGPAGPAYPINITIDGRNFADSTNTVRFGPVLLTGIRSTEGGKLIVFYAPKESPSTGEVPPAPLPPGTYPITVLTGAGESNSKAFVLTREPGVLR